MKRLLLILAIACLPSLPQATQPTEGIPDGTVAQPPSIHRMELEEHNRLGDVQEPAYPLLYGVIPELYGEGPGPEAMTRTVYGFMPNWVYADLSHVQWNLLTHVSYFCVGLNTDGSGDIITGNAWPNGTYVQALRNTARANGVKVTFTAQLFDSTAIATLLSNPDNRQNCIDNLLLQAKAGSTIYADGVCIDFEGVPLAQKTNLVTFMTDLTSAFHSAIPGSHVSICTPAVDWSDPRTFDYAQLAAVTDGLFIMAYDYHWSSSPGAGPVSPRAGSTRWGTYSVAWTINDYIAQGGSGNKSKFILGLPYYGIEWPTVSETVPSDTTGTGSSRTYSVAKSNSLTYGYEWDTSGEGPYYTRSGPYQCFYDDEKSLGLKWDLVNSNDLGGTGMWALNYDNYDDELWNMLEQTFSTLAGDLAGKKIGIDPGHGGDDPGAVGPTGLNEKDINLTGSFMLRDAMQAKGAAVYMTRTNDATMSLSARYNYFNSIPVDRAESYHHNASGTASANYTGVHVYWTSASGCLAASLNSRDMASKTALRLDDALNIGVVSSNCSPTIYGVHGDDFAMVHYTSMPAMLTEASFISNPSEEALLYTTARNCTIAGAIAKGIEDHYSVSAEEPPCAASAPGTCGNPILINSFPYTENNDTTGEGAVMNWYSCSPTTNEAGPELIYQVSVPAAGTITVTVTDGDTVDIDPHLLSTCNVNSCIMRNDATFSVFLQPGDYFLVCDTWTNSSGTQYPGAYTLNVTFAADTTAPVVTITTPTSADTYSTSAAAINIGGTASDGSGVSRVTWANSRGGSGLADGTTAWTISGITLYSGINLLTVTAYDSANNSSTDLLTVTCTDATAPAAVTSFKWQTGRWEWDAVTLDKSGSPETMGHYEIWRAADLRAWDFSLYQDEITDNYYSDPATPGPGSCWFYSLCAVDAVGNSEPPWSSTKYYGDATYSGSWIQGGSADCMGGSGQYRYATTTSGVTATATWSFTPTVTGNHHVHVRFVAGTTNRTIARYTVYYEGGSVTREIDQTTNNCAWIYLGTFPFNSGTAYTVVLDNQAAITGKVAIAEAVKWSR